MSRNIYIKTAILFLISGFAVFILSCDKGDTYPVPTSIVVRGGNEIALVETALVDSIEVIVKDQDGFAISGAIVNFSVEEGSLSSPVTNVYGKVSTKWTLGPTEGLQELIITAFTADGKTQLDGSPYTVTATAIKLNYGTFTDSRDGKVYITIDIGSQTWMAENLAYKGAGQQITDDEAWYDNWLNDNGWCYYNNDSVNYGSTYGILYQWKVAKDACPIGWHLPSDEKWLKLTKYLGGEDVARGKMKETGTTHWLYPNKGATNESGFTALPGGMRSYNGTFKEIGYRGSWWSITDYSTMTSQAYIRSLTYDGDGLHRSSGNKTNGHSVRCIKD